ncbi:signal transduction histidine kinase [Scopulibacillus darangshiensis]|uniref:histidine kinase n=1 Tax=Scopulibacillus darangshiensis TaxID=442528 RepID=A0A4R2P6M8_9BACL|nr:HAMP domain-containing sensor histidine kinase [Scopulibacillus darangshiensis]TCP30560.1 signal transduction histidine kinase [Scopulibacillus darangshiensis]
MIRRVVLYFMAVIILTLILVETIFAVAIHRYYYDGIEKTLISHAETSKDLYEKFGANGTSQEEVAPYSYVLETFKYKGAELQLVNKSGQIISSTTGFKDDKAINLDPRLKEGKTSSHVERLPNTNEKIMTVYFPVKINQDLYILRYMTSLKSVDHVLFYIYLGAILIGLCIAVFVFLVSLRLAQSIVNPIKHIISVASHMAKGNFTNRVTVEYKHELGDLSKTLNYMADEIQKTDQLKNEFISSISHELRTPLTGIKGWGETMLIDPHIDGKEMKQGLTVITNETERLMAIVEDLLDFSKFQANKVRLYKERIRLDDVISQSIDSLRIKAEKKGCHLISQRLNGVIIEGDENRLKQVLINIIDNAIKFAYKETDIHIMLEENDNQVGIIVKDKGEGIEEQHLPYLTRSFYQVKALGKGSGLGLSICKDIIHLHGGELDIQSVPADGTTVTVTLPKGDI